MAVILERVEHDSDWGRWTLVRAAPSPGLRGDVVEYQGYRERSGAAVVRREAPVPVVPVILIFDAGFRIASDEAPGWRPLRGSFVAGLHERSVLVGSGGAARCLQIDLTPFGARRLFGIDLGAIRNRVVALDELIGPAAGRLVDRLAAARGWPARFALLDGWLGARLGRAAPAPPEIAAAWTALRRTGGMAPVAELARRAGLSRQAFSARFERAVGLGPKRAARMLRLERALALLGDPAAPLAQVALACGYFDQAHFGRDMREFCGRTPRELRAGLLADGTGLMAGSLRAPAWHSSKTGPRRGPRFRRGSNPRERRPTMDDMSETSGVTASLFPALGYRDARAAADWLERAFGFERHALHDAPDGGVAHAEMRFGNGMVMFGSRGAPDPANPWTTGEGVYAVVEDIEAHYARAVAAGAEILRPLADTPYGAKEYTARDPEGHLWSFGDYRP